MTSIKFLKEELRRIEEQGHDNIEIFICDDDDVGNHHELDWISFKGNKCFVEFSEEIVELKETHIVK